jgi:hypothetical protein
MRVRTLAASLTLAVALACAYDAPRFEEQYLEAFCAYQETCDPPLFPSPERCFADEAEDREDLADCALDADRARACLQELRDLQCQGAAVNFPATCQPQATYTCGAAAD